MPAQRYFEAAGSAGNSLSRELIFLGELCSRLAAGGDSADKLEALFDEILADAERKGAPFRSAVTGLMRLAKSNAALRARLSEQLRVGDSLEMAADLQQSLQPQCEPGALPIWGVNLPARKLSGDFFDFYPVDAEHIAFALGDVSGKGMNAALLMAKTIGLFRCLGKRIAEPAALLEAINAELCETAAGGMFVTMVAGRYCSADGSVCFANAGHLPPLLRRRDRSYESFPAGAPPLGIVESLRAADERMALDGGELYVFTDGLTEYRYVSGERLGVEGLIQLIEALAELPLARRLEALLATLDQDGGWEARDDLTVLAIDDAWVAADAGIGQAGPRQTGPGGRQALP